MARTRYDLETKRRAVKDWVSGKRKAAQITMELDISSGQLSLWKQQLAKADAKRTPSSQAERTVVDGASGSTAPPPIDAESPPSAQAPALPVPASMTPKQRAALNAEQAAALRKDREAGISASDCAKKYGVSVATIYSTLKRPANGTEELATPSPSPTRQRGQRWPLPGMNVRDAALLLRQALNEMNTIQCPHCGGSFAAKPPGPTEALVVLAHHRLEGSKE